MKRLSTLPFFTCFSMAYLFPRNTELPWRVCLAWLFMAWFCLCLSAAALSDPADAYPKKIHFRNIMQNEDIALGEVEAILQDHQGFMWLGGRNALLRYDGYEFLPIPIANNPDDLTKVFTVNQIMELLEDSHQNIWVATRSNLYKYERSKEILHPIQDKQGAPLFREAIYALAETASGNLLVGSGSGLFAFNTQTYELVSLNHDPNNSDSLPSNLVHDILVAPGDIVWIGLNEGLLRIDWKTRKQKLFIPDAVNPASVTNNGVRTIAMDHQGYVWIGTDNGIHRFNPEKEIFKTYRHDPKDPHSLSNNISRQVYVDKQGWVWTGSDHGGISLYDEKNDRFLRFSHIEGQSGSLSSNTVRRIYEDKIGDIWVGTYPSGVNIYDRSTAAFTVYKKESDLNQGLQDNNVEAVEIDKDGNLWIGAGGISRYDPHLGTFTHYPYTGAADSPSASMSVLNGLVDSNGDIRFGSWANGVQLYNREKNRFEKISADPDISKKNKKTGEQLNDLMIWSIYEDKQNNLWFGTHYNGLTKFDKKTGQYTYYPYDPNDPVTISSLVVWTSFEDSQNQFWVGTAYGLNLMDREHGTFKRYLPDPDRPGHLVNGSVLCIHEDHKRRLWLGTDAGLHRYHPETDSFTVYGTRNGFFNEGIRAILEDKNGNLWLGTNNGIVMYNPDTGVVRNYTRYNGELIGGIATGSAVATPSGEMVFGTRNGLYIIDTDKLLINDQPPSVALTDFRIFTEKVPIGDAEDILTTSINQTTGIVLDYKKSMISFSFAALNYRDSDKNQYAYMLEGFDDKWREVGSQRTALYTNLPAKTYNFRVKASNNDGVWNNEGHSIQLKILPPPWKTWWAYSLYFLMGMGLLLFYAYVQQRKIQNERKTSRELEIKVAERTAELRSKNEELEGAYAQLEAISLSDPLTGINNRRYLQKIMPRDIAMVQREYKKASSADLSSKKLADITFFILDVDYFKSVNDIYGHAAGDQLLISISSLLLKISRESDCVIRWGGEEFLIVSRFTPRIEAYCMAERIREHVEQYNFDLPDGKQLKKTCSIGFASYPFLKDQPTAMTWEQVIDIADHALYAAKKSGRNRCVGLEASSSLNRESLFLGLNSNLKMIIEEGQLRVISEKPEDFVWD